ncbi:MAG TPA: acetyl-CoA carboxylase biotin carboxyl carrier protein [Rhizomicrobium sp.]|nr:acetyl-CoA carboxylase biotin carboxyl carrier protein [Rhizomicrobium sp.]
MNIKNRMMGARFGGDKAKSAVDAAAIRELAELLDETGLTEIEVERNGSRIRVARHAAHSVAPATSPVAPATSPVAHSSAAAHQEAPAPLSASKGPPPGAVSSPMVGTVYVAPEPGKPPFVKVGDAVKEGDTLFIVEAMKTMNPIVAPRSGTVSEICVHDAQPVEFGQTLLVIA